MKKNTQVALKQKKLFPSPSLSPPLYPVTPFSLSHTHSLGVLVAASSVASGDPSSTLWQYSHLADSGSDIRIDSTRPAVFRPKVVPRS